MRNVLAILLAAGAALAQPFPPTAQQREQIRARLTELTDAVRKLETRGADPELLADVAIYRKAGEWILRYDEEFFRKETVADTLAVLARGLERAKELERGQASWKNRKGRVSLAYRSRVDGSLQPYAVVVPESYDAKRSVRLDVILHGRNARLNEVSFLAAQDLGKPAPPAQNFIQLEVFGRTNNAYRWAGETDVMEAIAAVKKRYRIDDDRIVLRGFSMGGAGTWHIGLHYPDRWAAIEAGAGFTDTVKYAKQPDLPPYQAAPLHIYDAVDYALNAFNVPTVGYGGELDAQLTASVNIREQLTREGFHFKAEPPFRWTGTDLRALFLVGPQIGHKFHVDSKHESDEFIEVAVRMGRKPPERIRFVTYTTRFNRSYWVEVEGLEKHYGRVEVDAVKSESGALTIRTKNVARLKLDKGSGIDIDGQKLPFHAALEKRQGKWQAASSGDAGLRKVHGLQGPIDDAFRGPFLCVRPTGEPLHPKVHDRAMAAFDLFSREFAKWLRGDVLVRDDAKVSDGDIADYNLILFGDPGSNNVLARIAARLPIQWNTQFVQVGSRKFPAGDHMPVLIYPNPLNPKRYVVVNSGHTFHEKEFRGTNALLFPRLGDYAILGPEDRVALAGLFDDAWKLQ
ncbi:MAG: prolyl oligopeptidase family serine peptidase [Bryobacteraceae bacterium]